MDVREHTLLNEKIFVRTLSSGLKCYIMPKKSFVESQAIVATHYGSIDNKFMKKGTNETIEVPDGIAHFLEHKMFEEETGNVFDKFSELGSMVNAYTNFTSTAYYFSCTKHFHENLDLLLNFVQKPYFTDENVEKEKGIISQEISMYDDNADWLVFFNSLRAMYKEHPVMKNIAGSQESIKQINKDMLYQCHKLFYRPGNMAIVCVGDLDVEQTFQRIENYIQKNFDEDSIERIYGNEPNEIIKPYVEQTLSVAQPLFQIAFKETDLGYDGYNQCKREATTKILLNMLVGTSANIYQRLYNEGLIDDTFGFEYVNEVGFGHSIIGGSSKDPKKVQQYIVESLNTMKQKGLDPNEFERIKRKQIGRYIRTFNSVDSIVSTQMALCFRNSFIFDYFQAYTDVTIDEVNERMHQHLDINRMVLSVILPRS